MEKQIFEGKNEGIHESFRKLKKCSPERFTRRLALSWSNWGFGMEGLEASAKRLERAGIHFIELHGNHYGPDLGYSPGETLKILGDHGIRTSGICGMFSRDNDLSSNRPIQRQGAIDYIKRECEFAEAVGAGYMLVVPGVVGRPDPYDDAEFVRSAETLHSVADCFIQHKVKGAVEPVRREEVSLVHTVEEAKRYIDSVNHPGVRHINGDVFHMQAGEAHIGEAVLDADEMLVNLHLADSNRRALGDGSLDLDTLIMALYLIEYNREGLFVTPEPLGPGGDPYQAMYGMPDPRQLDDLVMKTADYFRKREEILVNDF